MSSPINMIDSPLYGLSAEELQAMEGLSDLFASEPIDDISSPAPESAGSKYSITDKLEQFKAIGTELSAQCLQLNDSVLKQQLIYHCHEILKALSPECEPVESIQSMDVIVESGISVPGEPVESVNSSNESVKPSKPGANVQKKRKCDASADAKPSKRPKSLHHIEKARNSVLEDQDDKDGKDEAQPNIDSNEEYSLSRKDPRVVLCETIELLPVDISCPVVYTPIESFESVKAELSKASTLEKLTLALRLAGNTVVIKRNCAKFRLQANMQHALTGLAISDLYQDFSKEEDISFIEFFKRLREFAENNQCSDPIFLKSYACLKKYVDYYNLYQAVPNIKYADCSISTLYMVGLVGLRAFLQNSQIFFPRIYNKFFGPVEILKL